MDIEIKPTRPKKLLLMLVIGIVVMLLIYFYFMNKIKSVSLESLRIEQVKLGKFNVSIITSGIIIPKTKQIISSQSSGILENILQEVGTQVDSHTIIMQLSNPNLMTEKMSSIASLKIANAELLTKKLTLQNQLLDQESKLIELKANLALATQKLTAKKKLFENGIYSKIDASQSQLEVDQLHAKIKVEEKRYIFFQETTEAQLEAENAKIQELKSQLELKTLKVDNLNIKAGINGVVQSIEVEVGSSISYGQELALVSKPYPLIALLEINQGTISEIKLKTAVTINVVAEKHEGYVSHIAPQVKNGLVELKVEFLTPLPESVKPQQHVSATIVIPNDTEVLWLPRPAHVVVGTNAFYKIDENNQTATRTIVEVGRITNNQIEVLNGLSAKDKVIISSTNDWKTNQVKLDD